MFQQINQFIWGDTAESMSPMKRRLRHFLQIMLMVGQDLKEGQLTLRAMSLVYTTLLSFVPLLAVSFSVLKGFGVHNQIEPFLLNFLSPLGDKSEEVTHNIVGFVENMKIGVLGALGLGILMFTVVSLIQKIESALNFTWRISSNRNLSERFSNYLSVVMVGPVLVFSALGISASLQSNAIAETIRALPYMGAMVQFFGLLVPTIMIILAFTLVYKLVPNARVSFQSAIYGAIISGILWKLTGSVFASFASGSTSYTAIYSGFAILLLFMIWLYLGWLILLIGASISYYYQNPYSLGLHSENVSFSAQMREKMALQLMLEIGRAYYLPEKYSADSDSLLSHIKAPQVLSLRMLKSLVSSGLILYTEGKNAHYVPAKAMEQLGVKEILAAGRAAEDGGLSDRIQQDAVINEISHKVSASIESCVNDKTLNDLVLDSLSARS